MKREAKKFIDSKDTMFARTYREKAKYLVASITVKEAPHPKLWHEVLKLSQGIS